MNTKPTGSLLRGLLYDGQVRFLLCETAQMTQAARDIHEASNVCTAALGRAISAAILLSASTEEALSSLTLTLKGGGPAGALVAVAHGDEVKAYLDNPLVNLPLREDGKLDVGGAIGKNGRISVIRDLGLKEPYIGQCALQSGEIAEDVAYYCAMSEQKPSICVLGVLIQSKVVASGGLLIQPLPGCEDAAIEALEGIAPSFADFSERAAGLSPEAILRAYFPGQDPRILETREISFVCNCSREKMERVLISLGREELRDMICSQHGAEIVCNFCRKNHTFSEDELQALIDQA